jgi:hypothetical protein
MNRLTEGTKRLLVDSSTCALRGHNQKQGVLNENPERTQTAAA